MIDGPELEENDDPEPEDLRVISPGAATSQAAFVAQIEAKAKADYEIAVLARKATAFLKEMDEQEKMEIKVAEFKSKQDEKKENSETAHHHCVRLGCNGLRIRFRKRKGKGKGERIRVRVKTFEIGTHTRHHPFGVQWNGRIRQENRQLSRDDGRM